MSGSPRKTKDITVDVIGGGLAGSEAAYCLLKRGYHVRLFERRPEYDDHAHETGLYGELVCSNSLKGKALENACGLLKEEIRALGSIIMEASSQSEVPAGNALAVDRTAFATYITDKLRSFDNFEEIPSEVASFNENPTILATGPLTDGPLLEAISGLTGSHGFSFYDASAPIVKKSSVDFSVAYFKSRYGQGDESYINCPFHDKQDYLNFVDELVNAKRALLHEESSYFEGCLPIEVLASRGKDTLRHGPLKPMGLEQEGIRRPYAVVQLRQDDLLGECYNIVGFQTNLTYGEQKRVFSMIPGLGKAEFVRYGLMHRNFFLDSPRLLNQDFSFKNKDNVFVAGQMSGVEGYVESAASGLASAIYLDRRLRSLDFVPFPTDTMLGALLRYVTCFPGPRLEPMNANWALLPGTTKDKRKEVAEHSLMEIRKYHEQLS